MSMCERLLASVRCLRERPGCSCVGFVERGDACCVRFTRELRVGNQSCSPCDRTDHNEQKSFAKPNTGGEFRPRHRDPSLSQAAEQNPRANPLCPLPVTENVDPRQSASQVDSKSTERPPRTDRKLTNYDGPDTHVSGADQVVKRSAASTKS